MSEEKETAINISDLRPDEPAKGKPDNKQDTETLNQAHQPDSKSEENIITDIEQLRNLDDISETGIEIEASASDLISLFETLEPDPSKTTTKHAGTQNQSDFNRNKNGQSKESTRKAAPHPGRKLTYSANDGTGEDKKRGSLNSSSHPKESRFDRFHKHRHHNSSGLEESTDQNANPGLEAQNLNSDANPISDGQPNRQHPDGFNSAKSRQNEQKPTAVYNFDFSNPSDPSQKGSGAISGDISHLSQADQQFYESIMFDQAPPGLRLDKKHKASLPDQPQGFSPTTIINEILMETQKDEPTAHVASRQMEQTQPAPSKTSSRKDRRKKSRNWKKKLLQQDRAQKESRPIDSQNLSVPEVQNDLPTVQSPSGQAAAGQSASGQPDPIAGQKNARHFVKVKSEAFDFDKDPSSLKAAGQEPGLASPSGQHRKFVKQRQSQDDQNTNPESVDAISPLADQSSVQADLTDQAAAPTNSPSDFEGILENASAKDQTGLPDPNETTTDPDPNHGLDSAQEDRKDKPHPKGQPTNPTAAFEDSAQNAEQKAGHRMDDGQPQSDQPDLSLSMTESSGQDAAASNALAAATSAADSSNANQAASPSVSAGKSNRRSRRKAKKHPQAKGREANSKNRTLLGQPPAANGATPDGEKADNSESGQGTLSHLSQTPQDAGQTSKAAGPSASQEGSSIESEEEENESTLSKTRADLKAIFTKLTDEMVQEDPENPKTSPEDGLSQSNKEDNPKLTFKERLIQFAKKAFKRPGTYALIIAVGAICYTLFKMFQLNLFKLSIVGLFVGICLAGLLLAGFWFFYTRHKLWSIPALALCAAIVAGSLSVEKRVEQISDSLREMSEPADSYVQNIGLYVPSIIPVSDLNALNGETFGIMRDRDETGVNSLLVSLADKGIYVHLKFFSNLQQMYKAVRGQAVRALILDQSDLRLIQAMAGDQTSNQLSLAYSLPVDTGVATPVSTKNLEKDPFTILVSGSSDSIHDPSYDSNLNLLVTVNPSTRQVLTTVLPRSLYIYNDCEEALACQPPDVPDRLSFVSYHSSEALRQTVEHLIESPVDFIVRLNTDKILQLFDIGQTIRFNPYGEYTDLNLSDGSVMTGPQIKQFLGALNDLSDEDLNQELNQLHVLYTLCRSTHLFDSSTFESTMKVLDESVWTSFDYNQLCQLARMFFLFPEHMNESWQIVTGTSSIQYSPTLTESTYMTQPDPETLQNARTAIQTVLDGGTPAVNGLPTRQALTGIPARPAGEKVPFNFINPSESLAPTSEATSQAAADSASAATSQSTDPAASASATAPADAANAQSDSNAQANVQQGQMDANEDPGLRAQGAADRDAPYPGNPDLEDDEGQTDPDLED